MAVCSVQRWVAFHGSRCDRLRCTFFSQRQEQSAIVISKTGPAAVAAVPDARLSALTLIDVVLCWQFLDSVAQREC